MQSKFFLTLLLSSFLSLASFAVETATETEKPVWFENAKEELKAEIKEQIANLELSGSARIFSADIMEGINASMKYSYQMEPSYKAGYFTRVDRWRLNAEIKAGDIIQDAVGSALPVYLNMNSGDEIVFIRHYKSQWVATRELPYTPLNLPLTAEAAIKHLKPGDFVSIPTELNVLMGASLNMALPTPAYVPVNVGAGGSYLLSSHFQLQIMKMANERVKVKLIAMRRNGTNMNTGASWSIRIFEIPGMKDLDWHIAEDLKTGHDVIDREVERQLDERPKKILESKINGFFERDIVNFGYSTTSGKLFEIDYTFDLKNAEAAAAYTELLNSTYRFKKLELFKSFFQDEFGIEKDKSKILITNLGIVEKLVQEDKNKDPSEARVTRLFKGQNDFTGSSSSWKVGAVLFKFKGSNSNHEDLISYFNLDEEKNNVLYLSNSKNLGSNFFLNLLKEDQNWNNFMLLKTDEKGNILPEALTDIGSSYSMTDKVLTPHEQMDFRRQMFRNFPSDIFSKIPWDKITTKENQKNVSISFQLLFDRHILDSFENLSREEILQKLKNFNGELKLITPIEMEQIADLIEECFVKNDKALDDSRAKIEKFMKFQRTPVIMKYGPRFFFSFLNYEQRRTMVYFNMSWSSTQVPTTNFTFGSNPSSELFPVFQRMQFLIDQGHFNLKMVEFDPGLVTQ